MVLCYVEMIPQSTNHFHELSVVAVFRLFSNVKQLVHVTNTIDKLKYFKFKHYFTILD